MQDFSSRKARFVVDEVALPASADTTASDLELCFRRLTDVLMKARDDEQIVAIVSHYPTVDCAGRPLYEQLSGGDIDRDCRLLISSLLDKCARLDEEVGLALDPTVAVNGETVESFALAYIHQAREDGRAVAAIQVVAVSDERHAWVEADGVGHQVTLVSSASEMVDAYRSVFEVEDLSEEDFFAHASLAFPGLRFADSVSFRRFDGDYRSLRSTVVAHLSAISDRFARAMEEHHGVAASVAPAVGVPISPESPNTRNSEELMKARDVEYRGRTYRCEWHSKLEPNRNRIHVCLGDERTDFCVLVGMFVKHLPT